MNAISNSTMQNFAAPIRLLDRLDPIPHSDISDADIENDHLLDILDMPVLRVWNAPLPRKSETISDVDLIPVPPSLIRRIEHEMMTAQYDARTVFHACRGLSRGSREFEDAYVAARIHSFAKQRRPLTIPANIPQPVSEIRSHPMAVVHLGDLMNHFGIWVIGLLALQGWAAWQIGSVANEFLLGGTNFYSAIALCVMLTSNSCVWFRRRGNLSSTFHIPGLALFLMALLPIFVLHLRHVLTALK